MHKLKAVIAWLFTPIFNTYVARQEKRKRLAVEKSWDDLYNKELATFTTRTDKYIAETVLKNQREYLKREAPYSPNTTIDQQQTTFRIAANVTRGIASTVNNLVGVQPLNGPVGFVYCMRYTLQAPTPTEGIDPKVAGNKIRLEITKDPVEAGTRKLAAKWSLEAARDALSLHDIDLKVEIEQVMGDVITGEVVEEVVADLINLSVKQEDCIIQGPQDFSKFAIHINRAASLIAARSRRGAGNFVIMNPIALSMLQSSSTSVFIRATDEEKKVGSISTLRYAGILNHSIKVYVSHTIGDKILVGYKGNNGETDAGYIYSPYVPVITTGVVLDPQTFNPVVGMMTRYGKLAIKPTEQSTSKASDYYTTFDVKYAFTDPLLGIDEITAPTEVEQHLIETADATNAVKEAVEVTLSSVDSQ